MARASDGICEEAIQSYNKTLKVLTKQIAGDKEAIDEIFIEQKSLLDKACDP